MQNKGVSGCSEQGQQPVKSHQKPVTKTTKLNAMTRAQQSRGGGKKRRNDADREIRGWKRTSRGLSSPKTRFCRWARVSSFLSSNLNSGCADQDQNVGASGDGTDGTQWVTLNHPSILAPKDMKGSKRKRTVCNREVGEWSVRSKADVTSTHPPAGAGTRSVG